MVTVSEMVTGKRHIDTVIELIDTLESPNSVLRVIGKAKPYYVIPCGQFMDDEELVAYADVLVDEQSVERCVDELDYDYK